MTGSGTGVPLPRARRVRYDLRQSLTCMHAIEIQGFSKDYAVGFWKKQLQPALRDLNLTVEAGETFGFLGPNGAGKTTALKLLMGITFPPSGSARILGNDFRDPQIKSR